MIPFARTEVPSAWPGKCVGCNGQQGPFVDTGTEQRAPGDPNAQAWLHVYLCQRCIEWSMQALSLDCRSELALARQEIDDLSEQLSRVTSESSKLADVAVLSGRLDKLEKVLAEP